MRIALIGANGQLGTDLHRQLAGEVVPLTHADIEVTRADSIDAMLDSVKPDLVLNTAAYNLVDKAETDSEAAMAANAWAPRLLALACAKRELALAHISSDFVFGLETGPQSPKTESDPPGPQGVYAASKLLGEYFVRSYCPKHFVIRTCGLYGQAATKAKGNFVLTMLRLAKEKPQLKVVADQRCVPSYTKDVAAVISALVQTPFYGLYHATNAGDTSWFEVASEAIRLAGLKTPVLPMTTKEFGAPAARPAYSVLNCEKIEKATGLTLRPWKEALAAYLTEIGAMAE
ncbi:MAG: dTDP-4-dehydrorhamnose reductase [Planctomycetaceae bacterium]